MRKVRSFVFLALAAVLVLTASPVVTPKAGALPTHSSETYFYSDNTYSTEVGYKYLGCDGYRYMEGTRTEYRVTYGESCGSGAGCVECVSNGVTVTCPGWVCFMYGNCC